MISTVPLWSSRAHATRGVASSNELVDRHAGEVPADTIARYRAALDASPEHAQHEFLVGVAEHLCLRLAEGGPDPIERGSAAGGLVPATDG